MRVPLPNTSRYNKFYLTFAQNGFSNWKKGWQRFQSHEDSSFHRAALATISSVDKCVNCASFCFKGKQKEMKDARKAFLAIVSSLHDLACPGLAVRGHDGAESNVRQLLELHAKDIPELQSWLCRYGKKCLSP
ncbi:unnamed protein product [Ixodes persulcatus]